MGNTYACGGKQIEKPNNDIEWSMPSWCIRKVRTKQTNKNENERHS
jgi:hypothetical protein